MHLEILVEEPSAAEFMKVMVPKIVGETVTFGIHDHESKSGLLGRLGLRLRAYASWIPHDWKVIALVDEDREDCVAIKKALRTAAEQAGLAPRVLSRIAVEELEAWYFGDVEALRAVYPRVPRSLGLKRPYRDPDAITGGTWEALERVLQKHGYFYGGLRKIQLARDVTPHMDPERNLSPSFRVFRDGLRKIVAG